MIYSKIFQKLNSSYLIRNGGGGIRTHGALADTLVFKTRALNHSTTPPNGVFSFEHFYSIAKGSDSLQ